jgi:fungal STAND N-terminal Goodbye domain
MATQRKYDLNVEWERACVRYPATTGEDPRRKQVRTPSEVAAQLEVKRSKDAKDDHGKDRAKEITFKMLD